MKLNLNKMVKGIRLKHTPKMDEVSEIDILAEIDVLGKIPDNAKAPDESICETEIYEGMKYCIIIMDYKDLSAMDSVMTIASTLEKACPELVKVFLWKDTKVVFSYPVLKAGDENVLSPVIEELLRFTTFVLSEYNTGECEIMPSVRIRKYIELFIKW